MPSKIQKAVLSIKYKYKANFSSTKEVVTHTNYGIEAVVLPVAEKKDKRYDMSDVCSFYCGAAPVKLSGFRMSSTISLMSLSVPSKEILNGNNLNNAMIIMITTTT